MQKNISTQSYALLSTNIFNNNVLDNTIYSSITNIMPQSNLISPNMNYIDYLNTNNKLVSISKKRLKYLEFIEQNLSSIINTAVILSDINEKK